MYHTMRDKVELSLNNENKKLFNVIYIINKLNVEDTF